MKKLVLALCMLSSSMSFAGTTDIGSVTAGPDFEVSNKEGCKGSGLIESRQIILNMGKSSHGSVGIRLTPDRQQGTLNVCDEHTKSVRVGDVMELSCDPYEIDPSVFRKAAVRVVFNGNEVVEVKALAEIQIDGFWNTQAEYDCRNLKTTYWDANKF